MPGTTSFERAAERAAQARAISCGEQPAPSRPRGDASLARRSACAAGAAATPISARSASSRLVSTVTPSRAAGPSAAAAAAAASSIARPPARMQGQHGHAQPRHLAHRTGHGVRDVVQLEVEKDRQPDPATASTPRGPCAAKNSSPSLMPPTCGASARARARVPSRSGRSTAQKIGLDKAGTGLGEGAGSAERELIAERIARAKAALPGRRSGRASLLRQRVGRSGRLRPATAPPSRRGTPRDMKSDHGSSAPKPTFVDTFGAGGSNRGEQLAAADRRPAPSRPRTARCRDLPAGVRLSPSRRQGGPPIVGDCR